MNRDKKNFTVIIVSSVLFIISLIFFTLGVYINNTKTKEINIKDYTAGNLEDYSFDFEKLGEKNDNYYTISGWVLKKGEKIKNFQTHIVLKEKNSDRAFKIPTLFDLRKDVAKNLSIDETGYSKCGFTALIKEDKLDNKEYQIYILYQNNDNNIILETDNFIVKEEASQ